MKAIHVFGIRILLISSLAIPAPASQKLDDKPSQQSVGALTIQPYVLETGDKQRIDAEMGRLLVPENRKNPKSKLIELAFVRLKSTSSSPGPPIFYLEGGPGGSGIAAARGPAMPLLAALREVADVILVDQRGTGLSRPEMICHETWDLPLDEPGDPKVWLAIAKEKLKRCAEGLKAKGVDPTGYNTEESADDIEALRRALGVEKISLWGISYGTHLALAMIRKHEKSIDRAILTGVNGPDHLMMKLPGTIDEQVAKLDLLFKADANISKAVPDLPSLIRRLLLKLEAKPVTVSFLHPRTRRQVTVALGKWDLQFHTASPVTQTWSIMSLPSYFYRLSKNDFTPLAERAFEFRKSPVGSLMAWMMISSSGVSVERYDRIMQGEKTALLGNAINFPYPEIREALGNPDLGSRFREPVKSKVPVLFISGTLDGRTPVTNAGEVGKGFPNGHHVIVEGASHGYDLFFFAPGMKEIMADFLRAKPVSTERIAMGPIRFMPLEQEKNKIP
ncbi:MAG TPA: alpha/beta fold hydrolase [Blastocatellia bacterium]